MTDPGAPRRHHAYVTRLTALLDAGRHGEAMALFMTTVGVPDHAINGMRNSPAWPAMETIAPTLLYDATLMGDSTLPIDLAAAVAAPTLILTGANSGAWAGAAAHALTTSLPHSRHQVLADQTHAVAWDVLAPALKAHFTPSR